MVSRAIGTSIIEGARRMLGGSIDDGWPPISGGRWVYTTTPSGGLSWRKNRWLR